MPPDGPQQFSITPDIAKQLENGIQMGLLAMAHVIHPWVVERSDLAKELVNFGAFDINGPGNFLALPTTEELSQKLRMSIFVKNPPDVIKKHAEFLNHVGMQKFKDSTLLEAVRARDPEAIQFAKGQLEKLQAVTGQALIDGKLQLS